MLIRQKDNDLKIIDIDKLMDYGDYIYDFGALIADIEVYNCVLQARRATFELKTHPDGTFSYILPENPNARMAADLLMQNIERLAKKLGDDGWRPRLELAKARYLLSMVPKTIDLEKAFVELRICSCFLCSIRPSRTDRGVQRRI